MASTATRPQLAHLTAGLDELKAKGTYFRLRVLDDHADAGSILLVGHNPGLENLVALMTEGASDSGRGIPPAGVVWMTLPDGNPEPGTAEVRHFWWP